MLYEVITPLPHGSCFGTRSERSIWYGATGLRGVFAEVAYYRLLFLEGTGAPLDRVEVELSAFDVPVRTRRGIDRITSYNVCYTKLLRDEQSGSRNGIAGYAVRR